MGRKPIPPIENPCHDCCLVCKKYSSVKEMHDQCETINERRRNIRRELYQVKKAGAKE